MTYRQRLFLYVFFTSFVSFWIGRALPGDRPLCDPCSADGILITKECRNDPSLWICEKAITSDGKEVVMCRPSCPRRDV